jgi:hypothetical protein
VNDDGEVVAIRVGDWKAIYLENRAEQLDVWREPFVHLRLPLLFNLRRDPFEKVAAQLEHLPRLDDRPRLRAGAAADGRQQVPHDHEGFPPSQTPGDWSLDSLEKQIKGMTPISCRPPSASPPSTTTARSGPSSRCISTQLFFALDRVKALAPQHPEWKDKDPFASCSRAT